MYVMPIVSCRLKGSFNGIRGVEWLEISVALVCFSFPSMYNYHMAKRTRFILALILVILSCALLLWGLLPDRRDTLIQPIDPDQMQLPSPTSLLPGLYSLTSYSAGPSTWGLI